MNEGPPSTPGPLRVVAPRAMTVAELNRTVKSLVEERFAVLWVQGEITAVKVAASGHVYFDLKDDREEARLACVIFKGSVSRSRAKFQNGERVMLRGKPTLYAPRGQFQFTAEEAVPAGAGAAAAALAALKEKLRAEGLFEEARKRPLPRYPRVIGVVTSASGAAFQDICRAVQQRWPARIVLAPTLVQGADAPAQIVKAIAAIQRVRAVEVLIVGRGGGASEDLAAFNDERVARAIAGCRVPVVSAVGHEVDHTVADLVADRRASTPTMAAEFCTPVLSEERERIEGFRRRLGRAALHQNRNLRLALQKRAPRDPRRRLDEVRMRLDDLMRRAEDALRLRLRAQGAAVERAEVALANAHPRSRLAVDRATLANLTQRVAPALERILERRWQRVDDLDSHMRRAIVRALDARKQRLGLAAGRLDALSPVAILARGYGVVLHEGKALTSTAAVSAGDAITVRLHDGELDARVASVRGR